MVILELRVNVTSVPIRQACGGGDKNNNNLCLRVLQRQSSGPYTDRTITLIPSDIKSVLVTRYVKDKLQS